jgi:hypothetical protein
MQAVEVGALVQVVARKKSQLDMTRMVNVSAIFQFWSIK